ncbi:MAG: hypothetical protein RLY16_454 [Bacteroidota bacterium]
MNFTPVTSAILAITVLVSLLAMDNHSLKAKLYFYPAGMQNGKEAYRFLTHGFIHSDWIHLVFNMLTLFFFGTAVEESKLFSPVEFATFYLSAIVAASIYDFFRQRNNYRYASLGASGAVAAVIFSTILVDPWYRGICIYGAICLPNIVYGVLYIWYCIYMDKKGNDNIGHSAHLWGSIYGIIFTAILKPEIFKHFLYQITHPYWL